MLSSTSLSMSDRKSVGNDEEHEPDGGERGTRRADSNVVEDEDVYAANFRRHRLCNTKYTSFHAVVFVLTFACNLMIHASRKSLGNVKSVISEEWTPSTSNATLPPKLPDQIWNSHHFFSSDDDPNCKNFLGGLDTAFMLSYAFGLFFSGQIGDRYNLRYVVCIGLIGNAITVFMFACFGEWFQLYAYWWYLPLWIFNGFFQSTGLPALVAMMGNWFGKSHRGLIFGFWSTNASVGNIFGSLMVAGTLMYGYEIAMMIPAVLLVCIALMMFTGIVVKPAEVNLPKPDADEVAKNEEENEELTKDGSNYGYGAAREELSKKNKPVGFFEALLLPGVIIYSVAYAGCKLVHYSLFYWLPFYLNRQYHWPTSIADSLSAWYDVGGIFGGIIGGYLSDKLRRSPVLWVMLLLAIPFLFIYKSLPDNAALNSFVLVLMGIFIGGVVNIMSAAIAADLGRQPKLRGNPSALATVTGIMDGIGSIGAAIGQLLVPVIQNGLGWEAVFDLFIICLVFTLICLLPIVYRELKEANFWHQVRHCTCCRTEKKSDDE